MTNEDPRNRMTEKVDYDHLRETAHYPSRWERAWDWFNSTVFARTAITIFLALAILVTLAIWFFSVVSS